MNVPRWLTTSLFAVLIGGTVAATIFVQFHAHSSNAIGSNPPFANLLTEEKAVPIDRFDPVPARSPVYRHVPAFTSAGQSVQLDAMQRPILFTAYWCPHCQRTLVLLQHNLDKLKVKPIVVSMGFVQGTTFAEAQRLEQAEMNSLHLQGLTIDYVLDPDQSRFVSVAYPTLVFRGDHGLQVLHSEHTLAVWERALSVS